MPRQFRIRNSDFGIRNFHPQVNFEFSILNFEFPPTPAVTAVCCRRLMPLSPAAVPAPGRCPWSLPLFLFLFLFLFLTRLTTFRQDLTDAESG